MMIVVLHHVEIEQSKSEDEKRFSVGSFAVKKTGTGVVWNSKSSHAENTNEKFEIDAFCCRKAIEPPLKPIYKHLVMYLFSLAFAQRQRGASFPWIRICYTDIKFR
jgi:hypothetical protein